MIKLNVLCVFFSRENNSNNYIGWYMLVRSLCLYHADEPVYYVHMFILYFV